jgi:diguanylate cyclase (GGDEF)-like protein
LHNNTLYGLLNLRFFKGLKKLNQRDIFFRHLDNIRLYAGAKEISIFHQQLYDSLEGGEKYRNVHGVSVNSISLSETPLVKSIEQQIHLNDLRSVYIVKHDEITTYLKITNFTLIGHEDALVNATKTFIPRQFTKAIPYPAQSYWLKLIFSKACPQWLNEAETQLLNEQLSSELAHLYRLLESTSSLLNIALEFIDLSSDLLNMFCSRSVLQNRITLLGRTDSVGLIMLHCMDFNQINKKFSHEQGDKVIREIASALRSITRESDILSRFNGALFGVVFSVGEQDDVTHFAHKLQRILQHNQYLGGAINLTFHLGAAMINQTEVFRTNLERATTLISRADQALNAAQQEKAPSIVTWNHDDFSLHQQQFNYLGGIFTADTVTDHRNMLLLWDISLLIVDKNEFSHLLQNLVQRLAQTFEFQSAGVISSEEKTDTKLLFSISPEDNAIGISQEHGTLKPILHAMQASVQSSNSPTERFIDDKLLLVLPLKIDSPDCFFISGLADKFQVTHDTRVLLSGLVRQLGKALRRSRLEEELNQKLETQNEQLQHELAILKEGIQESRVVFQSTIMHKLMEHAKRAAITDTTVLVTGESGTGKERLINALHTLGPRADKPFVIVDCGSIPETLIESELFGYVKGAFTGAQHSSKGKITDADGGVLVLDEIGELPLKMQTKLLRFVQEKHYTPVGGNRLLEVDVKIIAVTNRNLAEEVEKGSFRRDLYYRLNVLTLHNPPLRQRNEDIPLLSKHFLNKFSEQFNTPTKKLSANAMQKMQQYSWPGNIRELENRLMQATLMCEGDFIEWELLNIDIENEQMNSPTVRHIEPKAKDILPSIGFIKSNDIFNKRRSIENKSAAVKHPMRDVYDQDNIMENLAITLAESFSSYHQHPHFFNAPIGTWIEDDLILQTYIESGEKMRTTAARLHISQSKARRRVDKILAIQTNEPQYRPPNWINIEQALLPIANGNVIIIDCLKELKLTVIKVILDVATFNMAQAAEMLGVSEPTFYKLKKSLETKAV